MIFCMPAGRPASQPDGRMVGHYFDYFLTNIDFATKNLQVPRSKEKERKRGADVRTVWPDGKIKSSPICSKLAENVDTIVFALNVMLFKMPKQFSKYLGYFWNKTCCQELSIIAQFGHAAYVLWVALRDTAQKAFRKTDFIAGSNGCGSVGRAVASKTRGPWF